MFKIAVIGAMFAVPVNVLAVEMYDNARVTQVSPIYQTVNQPTQNCQTVSQAVPQERSNTGAIIGGVAGALLGSTIGNGTGQIAAGAVGAATGAIVGDRVDNRNNGVVYQDRQVCTTVNNYQQVVTGYNVTYEYNGRNHQTVMNSPVRVGDHIRVRISVMPY